MGQLITSLGINVWSLVVYAINFAILLAVLYRFAYKPIMVRMDERAERIRAGLEAAERARQEAAQAQEAMRRQMEEARQESAAVLEEARRAAERYREEERARAREELQGLREKALADIQRERDAAIEEVRRHFADLAIAAAEKVVQRSLDRRAHQDLIEQVLKEGGNLVKGKG